LQCFDSDEAPGRIFAVGEEKPENGGPEFAIRGGVMRKIRNDHQFFLDWYRHECLDCWVFGENG
jgi:hypothetical protein